MNKYGSIVCKLRLCLPKGPTNSVRMLTIVSVALQWQYLQTELILWIRLVQNEEKSYKKYDFGPELFYFLIITEIPIERCDGVKPFRVQIL
jgi:hypothetical protein